MAVANKTKKIFDNRYEIMAIVGRGSGSVVYHARHINAPSSEVALKVLVDQKDSSTNSDRLRKEALAMVSCRHKHVLRLDDFHSVGSLCYLCLEYAPESDLRKYVAKMGGRLGASQAELFLMQCAEALGFIHKAGIIHRDIKPDNILVMNHREIRICDFGIALLPGEHSSLAELQAGVGTMSYMSSEILEGKDYDHRADIYAIGAAFYEMVAGDHPFDHAPLMKQLEVREDLNISPLKSVAPEIPEYLSKIVMKALAYDPDKRFQSAKDLVRSIEMKELVEARDAIVIPPSPPPSEPMDALAADPLQLYSSTGVTSMSSQATADSPYAQHSAQHGFQESSQPQSSWRPTPVTTVADPFTSAVTEVIPHDTRMAVLHAAGIDTEQHHGITEVPVTEHEMTAANGAVSQVAFQHPSYERPTFTPASLGADHTSSAVSATSGTVALDPIRPHEDFPEIFDEPSSVPETAAPSTSFRERLKRQDGAGMNGLAEAPAAEPQTTAASPRPSSRSASRTSTPPAAPQPKAPRSKLRAYGLPIVLLFIAVTIFAIKDLAAIKFLQRKQKPVPAQTTQSLSSHPNGVGYLPAFSPNSAITFPALPAGVYGGTISRLIANEVLPLTIVANSDPKSLIVMIGIEGWTPRSVQLEPNEEGQISDTIRVASNGFILDFSADPAGTINSSNEISGTFRNAITGEAGAWKVRPVK